MIINQDILVAAQFSTDGKGFKKSGNRHIPWASTAEFLSSIPAPARHEGMIAWITNADEIELWHFVGGFADSDFQKYSLASVTSLVFETSYADFPVVGESSKLYIDTTTKTPYIWDGSYVVIGNPGPIGPKGDKGDKGDTGDTGLQGETGPAGPAGADGTMITLRTNSVDNAEQLLLNLVDSDTVTWTYEGSGAVKAHAGGVGIIRFKIGDGGADTPAEDTTEFTSSVLIGKTIDDFSVWRSGTVIYPGDEYTFNGTTGTITFVGQFGPGETILIR